MELGDTPKPSAGDLLLRLFFVIPLTLPLPKGDSRELRTQFPEGHAPSWPQDLQPRFQNVLKSVGHRLSPVNQRHVTLPSQRAD